MSTSTNNNQSGYISNYTGQQVDNLLSKVSEAVANKDTSIATVDDVNNRSKVIIETYDEEIGNIYDSKTATDVNIYIGNTEPTDAKEGSIWIKPIDNIDNV